MGHTGLLELMARYPATALAAVVALVAIAAAVAIFAEGNEPLAVLVAIAAPAITTILATARSESATNAARRADEGVQAAKEAVDKAVAEGQQTTPAALAALTQLLRQTAVRTERAAEKVEHAVEQVHNGNGGPH